MDDNELAKILQGITEPLQDEIERLKRKLAYYEAPEACVEHEYDFSRYCGAHVCVNCDHHKGLARCYCGWAASGGNGRRELVEMGETL